MSACLYRVARTRYNTSKASRSHTPLRFCASSVKVNLRAYSNSTYSRGDTFPHNFRFSLSCSEPLVQYQTEDNSASITTGLTGDCEAIRMLPMRYQFWEIGQRLAVVSRVSPTTDEPQAHAAYAYQGRGFGSNSRIAMALGNRQGCQTKWLTWCLRHLFHNFQLMSRNGVAFKVVLLLLSSTSAYDHATRIPECLFSCRVYRCRRRPNWPKATMLS